MYVGTINSHNEYIATTKHCENGLKWFNKWKRFKADLYIQKNIMLLQYKFLSIKVKFFVTEYQYLWYGLKLDTWKLKLVDRVPRDNTLEISLKAWGLPLSVCFDFVILKYKVPVIYYLVFNRYLQCEFAIKESC